MPRPARLSLTGVEVAICTVLALAFSAFGTVGAYLYFYY